VGLLLAICATVLACGTAFVAASVTNSIKTRFVFGATLSAADLDAVVKLANLCGIAKVTEVSTVRHLGNSTIHAKGEDKIEGRKVTFENLEIHRDAWEWKKQPSNVTKSVGEFWVEEPAKPDVEERTLVKAGERFLHVGLLNGVKPEGAGIILAAFLSGKVKYDSDYVKEKAEGIGFAQPSWIGISQGQCYITFASPLKMVLFRVNDRQVTITDVVTMYE